MLVTLGVEISLPVHQRVVALLRALEAARIRGVVNLHPAYCSILIRFDSLVTSHESLEVEVRELLQSLVSEDAPAPRLVELPVRYGG